MSFNWPTILSTLLAGNDLSESAAAWAMTSIMEGEATGAQFGAFVAALRAKGESIDEIVGLVTTMRDMSLKVPLDFPVVDTCGTGGDRAGTINVSTIAAFVVAGAGAKVAKHGNRAASSACGSADLLEELGVKIELEAGAVKACIEQAGIGFCFAPVFHPSMRHAGPPRRELGVPTIFNFLGPLTNPAGARHQAMGVSDPQMAPKMVEVLRRLGTVHALVFHADDGLDELSTAAPSHVWELNRGEVTESTLDPVDLGIARSKPADLAGGTARDNAKAAIEVLSGSPGAPREVVVLNAAAGLIAADVAEEFPHALELARASIDSGRAAQVLEALVEVSHSA